MVHGLREAGIAEALKQAAKEGKPVCEVVAAEGRPPVNGSDAEFAFTFQPVQVPGLPIEGTDRIDYKERGTLQNVCAGDRLAVKTPAAPGEDGLDVFGNAIPATPGADRDLVAVENVAVSDDGLEYRAEIGGVATLVGTDKIGVFQYYEVPGDVDYSTGNLDMDGTLNVRGWIRSGFTVRASGDLHVSVGIEDALVNVGGNIEVQGGIIGKESGRIRAAGHVQAQFVENGRIRARGDVVVRDSIVHSVVAADGAVSVTEGKGRIIGGVLSAGRGVEANELGTEVATKTVVNAGIDVKALRQVAALEKELAVYRRNKRKIALSLAFLAKKAKRGRMSTRETGHLGKTGQGPPRGGPQGRTVGQVQEGPCPGPAGGRRAGGDTRAPRRPRGDGRIAGGAPVPSQRNHP